MKNSHITRRMHAPGIAPVPAFRRAATVPRKARRGHAKSDFNKSVRARLKASVEFEYSATEPRWVGSVSRTYSNLPTQRTNPVIRSGHGALAANT